MPERRAEDEAGEKQVRGAFYALGCTLFIRTVHKFKLGNDLICFASQRDYSAATWRTDEGGTLNKDFKHNMSKAGSFPWINISH